MSVKTVFVIGAGASCEVDLPVGEDLKSKISDLLDIAYDNHSPHPVTGDTLIASALDKAGDVNSYLNKCWQIRDALPQAISIDNYLDAHRNDEKLNLCGKLGIVRSILMAENSSRLNVGSGIEPKEFNFSALNGTWYSNLWKMITEGCTIEEVSARLHEITFVVFNYDRCLEYFLIHAFCNYYNLAPERAIEIVKNCHIYHPYGQTGDLRELSPKTGIGFGESPSIDQLNRLAKEIKTFTEGVGNTSGDVAQIRKLVFEASRVVFLGFAYHKMNMDVVLPFHYQPLGSNTKLVGRSPTIKFFGSAFGISDMDAETIKTEIESRSQIHQCRLKKQTAMEFLHDHFRSLSLA